VREDFLNVAINGIGPVKLLVWKSREIRLFSSKADSSMPHLDKVGDDVLDLFKVPYPWSNPEASASSRYTPNGTVVPWGKILCSRPTVYFVPQSTEMEKAFRFF